MSYKKFDQADLEVIKNIIKDDERILYAENINEEYSHDELGGAQSYPDVVVKATSAEEISEIMKYYSGHTKRSWNRSGRIFRSDRTRDHDRFKPHESYIRT